MPKKTNEDTTIVFDENYQLPAGYKRMPTEHIKALAENGLKRCGKCNSAKPFDAFGANAGRADGLRSQCKSCLAAAKRAKLEAKYAALGRPAPRTAKAKKRAKFEKPYRADDYALIVPTLIEEARLQGHRAFDNPELRSAAAAKEILTERSDLVFFCSHLGDWYPATFDQMIVDWPKGNAKPRMKAYSRTAANERERKRMAETKAKNAAGLTETVVEKWCPSCCQTLEAEAFGVRSHSKDGLREYCKDCTNDRNTNRHFSKKHQTPPHLKEATASAWTLLGHVARVGEFLTGKQYDRDHLVAISKAVENETFLHQPSNLRLMEASANRSKKDRPATMAERLTALANACAAEDEGFEWSTADGLFMGTGEIELSDLYDDDCL